MKLIIAYIRVDCCANVMHELYEAGVGGVTAYVVHGMSGETSTFLHSKRPFEIDHLPESVKLEMVCADESIDKIVKLVAQAARTGNRGDGIIAVEDVERVVKIREIEPLS
ncbi:MAG TPA: P-II family nitrogen regulator [Candidatus Limnocylindrales bacterium]|nr:P-II family nitrogen regulator [Candidatus Limnocylindrales bacterium]